MIKPKSFRQNLEIISTFEWSDGSGDMVTLTYDRVIGATEVQVISDPNYTGQIRTITLEVINPVTESYITITQGLQDDGIGVMEIENTFIIR